MSKEVTTLGKRAVNRLVVGIMFLIIFGLVGGLAVFLLGVPLRGDIQDLGAGIAGLNTIQGLGQILWWAVSALLVAGIAIFLVTRARFLFIFKKVEEEPDIPRKTFIITFLVLGAIISFLFFLANSLLQIFGTDLSAVDIQKIFDALVAGDFMTLFVGLIFAIIVGTIIVAVANRTGSVQEAEEALGLPEKAKV